MDIKKKKFFIIYLVQIGNYFSTQIILVLILKLFQLRFFLILFAQFNLILLGSFGIVITVL